ncbi:TadE/TadG family type IV pilus assembly protein [Caballeronia sp. M23-90]
MKSPFQRLHLQSSPASLSRSPLRGFMRADGGAVAIEFVLIAPLMLLLLLGFTEMYLYMRAVSIVERTAFTLANSVGQMTQVINDQSTTNASNLGAVWQAATLIAAPTDLKANGGIILTSICDTTNSCGANVVQLIPPTKGSPTIAWAQKASWMGKNAPSSRITSSNLLPSGWPFYAGDSATAVEVFYTYTPFAMTAPFWADAPLTQIIYKVVYVRQRSGLPLTLATSG